MIVKNRKEGIDVNAMTVDNAIEKRLVVSFLFECKLCMHIAPFKNLIFKYKNIYSFIICM